MSTVNCRNLYGVLSKVWPVYLTYDLTETFQSTDSDAIVNTNRNVADHA